MHAQADIVFQIAVAIVTATAFAFLAKLLRQPLILGYIAAGVLIGPTQGLHIITTEAVEPIAELGLILLLFMIGLEIDLKKLRGSGKPLIAAGLVQFPAGVALGLLVAPLLGFRFGGGTFAPLYVAVAAALSSTMIVVKLLYDKRELDTLPGRITLGVLVFQDIWAILFLGLQPDLRNPAPLVLALSLAKAVALIAFALLASRYVLPRLFRYIAKIPELLLIGALAWCFLVALVAARLGLSLEMGALIAGVSLSTFPYNLDVIAKVISLRDFFITLFFVTLGARVPRPTWDVLLSAAGLSAFLVASRFATLTPLLHALRQGNRVSVIPALNLSQMSEFSLVICAIGLGLGHLDERTLAVVVITMIVTAVLSTYAIQFNHEIFGAVNRVFSRLGMRDLDEMTGEHPVALAPRPIVFVGFWRHASSVLHELLAQAPAAAADIAVIDFNPQVREELNRRGIANLYGDVSHPDTLHHANIHHADVLVCTLSDAILRGTTNRRLLRALKAMAPAARIIVTTDSLRDAADLYAEGAAFVYVPRLTNAAELARVILAARGGGLEDERAAARAALGARDEVLR
jgi:Kef-type K+ transport system membrane component KefB